MELRNKRISVIKSNDPEKLLVFHASSIQNEIRFYLNNTQYFTAVECEEGCIITLEEEKTEECNKKSKISTIRENIKLLFIILSTSIIAFAGAFYLVTIINNILAFFIILDIICFIVNIANVVIIEITKTAPAIKSKHSAEHMMVNFLETNKRLPKSIEELKKASRFSSNCGSSERIKGIAEDFIHSLIATIVTCIVSVIVLHFPFRSATNAIVLISIYYIAKFVVEKAITKYGVLNFIIKPIEKVLTNIAQCANTTRNVKESDIIMAYSVAKEWLKVVYPQFYNEDEDIFWKQ